MKLAVLVLVLLPVVLSLTLEEKLAKGRFDELTHEERLSVQQAYEAVKNYLMTHVGQVSSAACSVACASATALETMGISAPLCVAACGLIGLFG